MTTPDITARRRTAHILLVMTTALSLALVACSSSDSGDNDAAEPDVRVDTTDPESTCDVVERTAIERLEAVTTLDELYGAPSESFSEEPFPGSDLPEGTSQLWGLWLEEDDLGEMSAGVSINVWTFATPEALNALLDAVDSEPPPELLADCDAQMYQGSPTYVEYVVRASPDTVVAALVRTFGSEEPLDAHLDAAQIALLEALT